MGRKLEMLKKDGVNELDAWLEKLQFLSDAMESTAQPFCAGWPDGRLFLCNDVFCELTGYIKEELFNNATLSVDLILPERRESVAGALRELHRPGKPQRYEKAYTRKDGRRITVKLLIHKALDSAGNVLIYYSFITDITERKTAEELSVKNEETLRRIIETSPVPMVLHNEAGNVLYINKKFTETFGYTLEDMPSINEWWTLAYPDEEYREFVKKRWFVAIDYAIKNNARIVPREVEVTCNDGSKRHILSEFSSIGNINLSILYDFTERKRVEEELNEAKLQAELYLDLMGHDISNMHQIAMGQLELAKEIMAEEGGLKFREKELIETPLETLNRSARLIENVRNLQKMRGGEFREEIIDLNGLLASIVTEYESIVPANSIKFVSNVSCCVMANKLLHDVFSNLIGNAIKHSKENDIEINIKLENVSENNRNYDKISVEDNGQGIPDDLKDKIFSRLQRGETKARGLGLGLYLVKSLVDSYHGKVWVEDRISGDHTKGARFVVLLPAIEVSKGC